MTYLNNLKNILSNKKFDYIILLTTIGLLNGHNIYASQTQLDKNTLENLLQIYIDFLKENKEKCRKVSEEYAATLLNKNRDRIKNVLIQYLHVNLRGTSCISRCCCCKSFADSFVLTQNKEKIYLKSLVETTFFMYDIPTQKMLYIPTINDYKRCLQHTIFECFDKNLSELTSSLKEYYQKNKSKYPKINISDNTFNNENIKQMLFRKKSCKINNELYKLLNKY